MEPFCYTTQGKPFKTRALLISTRFAVLGKTALKRMCQRKANNLKEMAILRLRDGSTEVLERCTFLQTA